jgi:uncharacterized protein YndB with AHSA1/START domain
MTTLRTSVTGPTPPEEVWERYARPALWPTWAPQIQRVEVAAERLSGGETGRVFGPLGFPVDFTVDSWDDAGRVWSWTVAPHLPLVERMSQSHLRLEHGVEPSADGSRTWLRVTGFAPLVAAYLPVTRLALYRLVH